MLAIIVLIVGACKSKETEPENTKTTDTAQSSTDTSDTDTDTSDTDTDTSDTDTDTSDTDTDTSDTDTSDTDTDTNTDTGPLPERDSCESADDCEGFPCVQVGDAKSVNTTSTFGSMIATLSIPTGPDAVTMEIAMATQMDSVRHFHWLLWWSSTRRGKHMSL